MATSTVLVVCIQVRWQLYVAAKTDIRCLTAPRTTKQRRSGFSELRELMTAARGMDSSVGVDRNAVFACGKLRMTTSSWTPTYHLLHQIRLISPRDQEGDGQQSLVLRWRTRKPNVREEWSALPPTTSLSNTSN